MGSPRQTAAVCGGLLGSNSRAASADPADHALALLVMAAGPNGCHHSGLDATVPVVC